MMLKRTAYTEDNIC